MDALEVRTLDRFRELHADVVREVVDDLLAVRVLAEHPDLPQAVTADLRRIFIYLSCLIVIILLCFSLVNKSYIIILKNIYTLVNQYISKEMLSHTAVQQHCSPARVQAKGNQKFQEREVNTFERFSLWKIMAWPLAVPGQFFRSAPPVTTKHLSSEWRTMRCHLEERCILALFPFHPTAMRTRH